VHKIVYLGGRIMDAQFKGKRSKSKKGFFKKGVFYYLKIAFSVVYDVLSYWFQKILFAPSKQSQLKALHKKLDEADTYQEWKDIAEEIDHLQGKTEWKENAVSSDYDYKLIEKRLSQMRHMRENDDIWSLVFLLRAGLSRNLGGIGNSRLFSQTKVGTKKLIEDYVNELGKSLEAIAEYNTPEFPLKAKIEFFAGLRQVFGRSALLLSGGAAFGLYHLGVMKCLFEHKLIPRIFSGSSAGSLMAALICTRTDEELPSIFDPKNINLEALEKNGETTFSSKIKRLREQGYLFDIHVLQACIRGNCGDITFQEAFNRTRRILNITVSSSTVHELPRLLNYLTAPDVLIWSAASASCAIPWVYKPVPLLAKAKDGSIVPWNPPGTVWVDGSVENDLPMTRLSEQFNVNHFIVSQVNPHVIPVLNLKQALSKLTRNSFLEIFYFLISSEVSHRLKQISELGLIPSFFARVAYWVRMILSQGYQGDITVFPPLRMKDFLNIMTNPSEEEVLRKISVTQRAAWANLSIVEMHCRTEKQIDTILYQLRVKMLAKHGKVYRPMDFAFGLTADDKDENGNQVENGWENLHSNASNSENDDVLFQKKRSQSFGGAIHSDMNSSN